MLIMLDECTLLYNYLPMGKYSLNYRVMNYMGLIARRIRWYCYRCKIHLLLK